MVMRFLFLVHGYPPVEYTGAPLLAHEYATALSSRGFPCAVLYPAFEDISFSRYERKELTATLTLFEVPYAEFRWLEWSVGDSLWFNHRGNNKDQLLRSVVDLCKPDVAVLIDLVNLPTRWIWMLRELHLPIVKLVLNGEDVCGLIEPFDRTRFEPCPVPLRRDECAEQCLQILGPLSSSWSQRTNVETALKKKWQLSRMAFESAFDLILFRSQGLMDMVSQTMPLPLERCAVLEPGVTITSSSPSERRNNSGCVRIGYVGTLSHRKGIPLLVALFGSAELLQREDYELHIYGSGNENLLADLLRANPRVFYHGGYTPEQLPHVFTHLDVGINPSYFEGSQKVLREFLATGLPVISSRVYGASEVLRDGENGLLVDVGDSRGFLRSVLAILNDGALLKRLQEGARRTAVRTFEEELTQFTELCQAVVSSMHHSTHRRIPRSERMRIDPRNSERTSEEERIAMEVLLARQANELQELRATLQEHRDRIVELEKAFDERTSWALRLDKEINEKNAYIAQLQKEFKERTNWALSLARELAERKEYIGKLQREYEDRTRWALELDDLVRERDRTIATLQKEYEERTRWAVALSEERKNILKRQQELYLSLDLLQQRLHRITSGRVYRLLSRLGVVPK